MNYKKVLFFLLIVSVLGMVAGYLIFYPETLNLCTPNADGYCYAPYGEPVGQPIFFSLLSVSIVLVVLLFFGQEVFDAWKKFAVWAIPIGAIIIFLVPANSPSGLGPSGPDLDREIITWFVSITFLIISLLIILLKSLKLRRQNN